MNAYQNATQFFENLDQAITGIEEGFKKAFSPIQQGPPSYYFQKINQWIRAFFESAPFKVGDRIKLIREPKIEKRSGWWSFRHTFKTGATAVVKELDYVDGQFCAWVKFDKTLCDGPGSDECVVEIEQEHAGYFHLWESYFVRLSGYEVFVSWLDSYEQKHGQPRQSRWEKLVRPKLGPGSRVFPKHTGKGELLGWVIVNPITLFTKDTE